MLECIIADPSPRDEKAKRVSIIGDSISSFAGYIPAGYNYHYPCADGSVTRVEQTYWWQLIYNKMKNARLDVNMSYSGTAVANSDDAVARLKDHWVNNSFVQRYILLGGIGDPDIVVIHGGTNDSAHGDKCPLYPGSEDCGGEKNANQEALKEIYAKADAALTLEDAAASRAAIEALADNDFCSAYVKLPCLIKQQYPDTKIVCVIGDYLSTGIQKSIISIANHYGARYVDLYAVNGFNDQTYMPKHDYNGTSGCHPNAKAMEFISEKIYSELGAWLEE
jgi:lysophospholipase L1-like esterase